MSVRYNGNIAKDKKKAVEAFIKFMHIRRMRTDDIECAYPENYDAGIVLPYTPTPIIHVVGCKKNIINVGCVRYDMPIQLIEPATTLVGKAVAYCARHSDDLIFKCIDFRTEDLDIFRSICGCDKYLVAHFIQCVDDYKIVKLFVIPKNKYDYYLSLGDEEVKKMFVRNAERRVWKYLW